MKKHWLIVFYFIIFVIFLSGCQSYATDYEQVGENEKIVIRFSHVVGENTPKGQAAVKFAQLVKERSRGKIEVQVFPDGSLYKDGEEWDALKAGNVQMIAPAMSKMTSFIPELKIFDLPFFFNTLEEVHRFSDGEVGKRIFNSAKSLNIVPLTIWDNGFKQMTNRDFPLREPDDFKGLTFRIMPSDLLERQFHILGAHAEAINFNDVYQELDRKRIDGQENTISNIYTKEFYKKQNYLMLTNHGYLGYLVMMNKDFWAQLKPEEQKLIREAIQEVTSWQRQKTNDLHQEQLQEIKSCQCIAIEELTQEERKRFKDKFIPLYQEIERELEVTINH